jgi:hypothetical protein
MTDRQCFGVAVRIAGLAALLYGVFNALTLVVFLSFGFSQGMSTPWGAPLLFTLASFVVGRYLLGGGAAIQRLAYPDSSDSAK